MKKAFVAVTGISAFGIIAITFSPLLPSLQPDDPPSEADMAQACQVANAYLGPAYARQPEPCEFKAETATSGVIRIYIGGKKPFDALTYTYSGPVERALTYTGTKVHVSKLADGKWHPSPSAEGLTRWN